MVRLSSPLGQQAANRKQVESTVPTQRTIARRQAPRVAGKSLPRGGGNAALAHRAPEATATSKRPGIRTVLVLEDEADLRGILVEMLHALGYDTIAAADGADGMNALRSDAPIDLLIADFRLPGGVNGRQVAQIGRTVRPGLKVLFITGCTDDLTAKPGTLISDTPVLAKPFRFDALAREVARLTGGA